MTSQRDKCACVWLPVETTRSNKDLLLGAASPVVHRIRFECWLGPEVPWCAEYCPERHGLTHILSIPPQISQPLGHLSAVSAHCPELPPGRTELAERTPTMERAERLSAVILDRLGTTRQSRSLQIQTQCGTAPVILSYQLWC